MNTENLRQDAKDHDRWTAQRKDLLPKPPKRREINRGIRDMYRDTGVLIELMEKVLGTTSFEIERPDFSKSDLPQSAVAFFETQYRHMPEDNIIFRISAAQDDFKNHNVCLELNRRGLGVSNISFCCYVRSRSELASHVWVNLDHEEMQPMPTVEARNEINELIYHPGEELITAASHLEISRAILNFAVNEAEKHVRSETQELV